MAVKFDEAQVRVMGTGAAGVRGVMLQLPIETGGRPDSVVGLAVASDDEDLLVVGEHGLGKRSKVELFRKTARGAKGVIALRVTDKTGALVGAVKVTDEDDLLIITNDGMIIRMEAKKISQLGRATQGVKLINLRDNSKVTSIEVIEGDEDGEGPGLFEGEDEEA